MTFKEIKKYQSTKKREIKIKTSIFYFTVNSNKSTNRLTEDEIDKWKAQQRDLWSNKVYYLLTMHPSLENEGIGEYFLVPEDKIININVEIAFEVGSQKDRLHLHGIIKVTHTTKLRLNYKLIHTILNELMGEENQYFHSVVRSDDVLNFIEYMLKFDSKIEKFDVK